MTVGPRSIEYRLCADTLLRRLEDGSWVATNPRVHRHVEVDPAALSALTKLSGGATPENWSNALNSGWGWVRSRFTNASGLMVDPTGCGEKSGEAVRGEALFNVLREAWILCDRDAADYEEFLAPQASLLDDRHLGTFHQVLGRHLFLQLRQKETWRWWHDQKFTADGRELKPGLYKWIQWRFLERFFGVMDLSGLRVLDFACGNGFYSRYFQSRGAEVLGIDTSPELIAIAKENWGREVEFIQPKSEIDCENVLSSLKDSSFDRIYMGDALLFFFHNLKAGQKRVSGLQKLLSEFRRLLKPDGILYVMEPNGTFWLSSWLGTSPRPVAVITEYRNRVYHVAPTVDAVISALGEAGFLVANLVHPTIQTDEDTPDAMTQAFAQAFPLWDFYTCVPAERATSAGVR